MYMGLFKKKKKTRRISHPKGFFDTTDVFERRLEKEWRKRR